MAVAAARWQTRGDHRFAHLYALITPSARVVRRRAVAARRSWRWLRAAMGTRWRHGCHSDRLGVRAAAPPPHGCGALHGRGGRRPPLLRLGRLCDQPGATLGAAWRRQGGGGAELRSHDGGRWNWGRAWAWGRPSGAARTDGGRPSGRGPLRRPLCLVAASERLSRRQHPHVGTAGHGPAPHSASRGWLGEPLAHEGAVYALLVVPPSTADQREPRRPIPRAYSRRRRTG